MLSARQDESLCHRKRSIPNRTGRPLLSDDIFERELRHVLVFRQFGRQCAQEEIARAALPHEKLVENAHRFTSVLGCPDRDSPLRTRPHSAREQQGVGPGFSELRIEISQSFPILCVEQSIGPQHHAFDFAQTFRIERFAAIAHDQARASAGLPGILVDGLPKKRPRAFDLSQVLSPPALYRLRDCVRKHRHESQRTHFLAVQMDPTEHRDSIDLL